ncbi:hypothetical protein D042_0328 [Vibrio parahaemolyticus NIHCB0757]|nr:hypothetical protein D042_0328 [Vibrio parahaemolyticus NIHCB0757]
MRLCYSEMASAGKGGTMELWIWLIGLIATIASVGGVFWYAGHYQSKPKRDVSK